MRRKAGQGRNPMSGQTPDLQEEDHHAFYTAGRVHLQFTDHREPDPHVYHAGFAMAEELSVRLHRPVLDYRGDLGGHGLLRWVSGALPGGDLYGAVSRAAAAVPHLANHS